MRPQRRLLVRWRSGRFVLGGSGAVLIFDTTASFASVALGFSYAYAATGSVLIYVTIGYLAFRTRGVGGSVQAALLVQLVDAAVGWPISWVIGASVVPADQLGLVSVAITLIAVAIFAVVCGLLGAGAARLVHGKRLTAARRRAFRR